VNGAFLAPLQALVASSNATTTTSTTSSTGNSGVLGQANQVAAQVDQTGGWLYHLLVKLGVSPDTASTVTDLIVRPLSILIVVLVAALVARYGAKVIRRFLTRVSDKAATRSGSTRAGARVATMSSLAANVWRLFVFVVAGAIVLGMLGINLTPLLASATIIGATLGFGAQQIVRDYFSGALMTMEDQYNIGDSVTVGGVTGVIEDVTMRLTRFRGVDGTLYVIPNGDIRLIGNLSRGWARAVCDLTLPGAAAADLDRVRSVIGGAAHEVAQRPEFAGHVTEPPQVVGLLEADSATITMRVMLLTVPSQRDPLTRALREAAIEALARAELWPAGPAAGGSPEAPGAAAEPPGR
jgi:small conductance mechanosensitive channel